MPDATCIPAQPRLAIWDMSLSKLSVGASITSFAWLQDAINELIRVQSSAFA